MSRVYTDTLEPRKSTQDITLGTSGETISVAGDSINVNTVKDKGGNTLWTSDGSGVLSSVNSALKGNLVLLSTETASDSASLSFTTGIDSTYDVYIFKMIEIQPGDDNVNFGFQVGSGYNTTVTSTYFQAIHYENGTGGALAYEAAGDQQQGTSVQTLGHSLSNGADAAASGELHWFSPSSTTYVKQWYSTFNLYGNTSYTSEKFAAGYFNTTSALTQIQFKTTSGNMASGTIKMYGLL